MQILTMQTNYSIQINSLNKLSTLIHYIYINNNKKLFTLSCKVSNIKYVVVV